MFGYFIIMGFMLLMYYFPFSLVFLLIGGVGYYIGRKKAIVNDKKTVRKTPLVITNKSNRTERVLKKNCSKCNVILADNALFCHICGKQIYSKIKFCSYCGTHILKDAVFCHKCGNTLKTRPKSELTKKKVDKQIVLTNFKTCSFCGSSVELRGCYCWNCGNKF